MEVFKESSEKAIEYFKLAADQGLADAQNAMGEFFEKGRGGLSKSYEKAAEYFKLAADQGHASPQNDLGLCYEFGDGFFSPMKKLQKATH